MSVEFDPVRLDKGRRRFEPAVIGAIVMVIAVGAAIAKPWEQGPTTPHTPPSAAALAASAPPPASTPTPEPPPSPSPPNWLEITNAVTAHDDWGVTAVLVARRGESGTSVSPPTPRYLERWAPTSTDATGGETAYIDRGDRSIVALGVTVPDGIQPRSVRIWRLHEEGEFEWMSAARIDNLAGARSPLLIRLPLIDDSASAPWEAGQYRVDVLTGDGIHRISLLIPNRFGNVPRPDDPAATVSGTVAASASDPSAVRIGLFATVDGAAVSIPARESEALGEAQAWGDATIEGDSTVGTTWLPRATGLGVMLTSHAAVGAASIRRLAPGPLLDPPPATGGISDAQGRTPFIVFAAPDGGVWTPGVYAVTVDWEDAAGAHRGTWHVELRPGVG